MTSHRAMWQHSNQLKKQNSCAIDNYSIKSIRTKPLLQKQVSVDHTNRLTVHNSWTTGDNGRPEASLKILTAVKKRIPPSSSSSSTENFDAKTNERQKKTTNKTDDRINLNIFLSHNTNSQDGDYGSDLDSEKEGSRTVINKNDSQPTNKEPQKQTAAERRAQFQSTKSNATDRKVPLIRAMSAPARSLDESGKVVNSKKRVLRRKKIGREKEEALENTFFEADEENEDNDGSITSGKGKSSNKKGIKGRTTLSGCDVVTLVSLLSSGGSDSEREDAPASKAEGGSASGKPPMLGKTGKSVSFQENDDSSTSSTREFPPMLRRGSIVPLAVRIRAKRPPTAPPGSIYRSDFSENSNTMTTEKPTAAKSESENNNQSPKVTRKEESSPIEGYPENCRTKKERECWKLFQKMLNKGIHVSYETILRGMLTPTELRARQKQQKEEEDKRLQQQMDEKNPENKSTTK